MAFLLALALTALEWRVVRRNIGTLYNGYGAIIGVLDRNTAAPMRYRVLVPWLVGWLKEPARIHAYQAAKGALLWLALWASEPLVGWPGLLWLAFLIALTFEFDYWDCYAELAGAALCLSGSPWLVGAGALVWGLSKETAVLAPFLALTTGGWGAALIAPITLLAVRLVQGKAALYCDRWTLKTYNRLDLYQMRRKLDPGPLVSLAWLLAAGWAMTQELSSLLAASRLAVPVWLAAGWLMARARETRVFLPVALWIAGAL